MFIFFPTGCSGGSVTELWRKVTKEEEEDKPEGRKVIVKASDDEDVPEGIIHII